MILSVEYGIFMSKTNSVCVCVCVFLFFHREGFFCLQNVQDILEGTDQRSCVVNISWCSQCVVAAHTPGTINIEADKQSRALEDATEWKLNPTLLHKMLKILEKQTYISLLLELISNWIDMCLGIRKPEAMAINAFSLEQQQSLEKL